MVITNKILAEISAGVSELKKNPMAVVREGGGGPVAILNRNEPVELRAIVDARKDQREIKVSLDEL